MGWHCGNLSGSQGLVIDDEDGRSVAVAYDTKDTPLLAAAPEMYEAIQRMIIIIEACDALLYEYDPVVFKDENDYLGHAREVARKAEGKE